jgi:hypothetical protein
VHRELGARGVEAGKAVAVIDRVGVDGREERARQRGYPTCLKSGPGTD